MKIPNKLIKFLLKKETSVLLPKRIIRLIIKKNRVFFLKTTLFKLPKNNYPFILSQSELNQFFSISKNYKFELPLTEFPQLALVLNLIFNKKKKFKFLDFGAQYIDNYFFIKNKNNNIKYFYCDQEKNNITVKEFNKKKKLKDFIVLKNYKKIKNYKFDFINFGSVIQYIDEPESLIKEITFNKPQYLFFNGVNMFWGNRSKKIICKQLNTFPKVNYCHFFQYDYFKKFIKSQKYNLIYVAKNQNSSIINYSNLKESISKDCKYLDLLFKLKK